MIRNHARLILALSVFLLSIVALDFVSLGKNFNPPTPQPKEKIDLVQAVNELGKVLGGCDGCDPGENYIQIWFYNTGELYPKSIGATYNSSGYNYNGQIYNWRMLFDNFGNTTHNVHTINWPSDATLTLNPLPAYAADPGGDNTSSIAYFKSAGTYTYYLDSSTTNIGTITVTAVSNTSTSTTTGGSTTTSINKKTTTTTKKPETKVETIKDVKLPDEFKAIGTQTTDLSSVSDTTKIIDLKLDSTKNTIKFNEPVDLSATDTKDKFKTLDTYVHADKIGVVSIDSANLPALNKKATLTMKNLSFVKTPKVLVNGKVDPTVVSNIHYLNGTLTFDITHFSTFTAAPTVGITDPADKLETKDNPITLRGTVSDPTASVSAKLNNKDLGRLKVATASGIFEKQVTLEEGVNKIVVTALSTNGSKAVASVSATILKAAAVTGLMPYYVIIALLAFVAALSFVIAFRALKKHHQPKGPGTGTGGSAKPNQVVLPSTRKVEPTSSSINSNSSSSMPWENNPTPKVS